MNFCFNLWRLIVVFTLPLYHLCLRSGCHLTTLQFLVGSNIFELVHNDNAIYFKEFALHMTTHKQLHSGIVRQSTDIGLIFEIHDLSNLQAEPADRAGQGFEHQCIVVNGMGDP